MAPTLIVWGEEDAFFPLADAQRLHREIAASQLATVPLCGHSPHEERPDVFLRLVVPFLEGGDAPEVPSA